MELSTKLASLRATGVLTADDGKVMISNFDLTAPGFMNPLTIVSAPTHLTIYDAPDGTLRIQTDRRLTIRAPLEGNVVDDPAAQYIVPDR
jgi:hypothetical protein